MTQEQKELLLKDLCARLSYGVRIHSYCLFDQDSVDPLYSLRECNGKIKINDLYYIEEVKPYLFPLSSMTEEQEREDYDICKGYIIGYESKLIDFYNKNHIDYRGLIDMGLAIDATNKNIY